jgi:hypothetical protein
LHEYHHPENEPGEVQAYFERLSEENANLPEAGMSLGSPPMVRRVDGEVAAPRRGGSPNFPSRVEVREVSLRDAPSNVLVYDRLVLRDTRYGCQDLDNHGWYRYRLAERIVPVTARRGNRWRS